MHLHYSARITRWCLFLLLFLKACLHSAAQEIDVCTSLHIVILGDSNTWLGGDNCDKTRGWNSWFSNALQPIGCRSYARSGATWTNTQQTKRNVEENTGILSDDNVIYNQICRLDDAVREGKQARPDLILISAGTNDAWFPDKRPGALQTNLYEVFSSDTLFSLPATAVCTLAEAVRWNCELLRKSYPEARIVLLTPLQSTSVDDEKIRLAGNIIEGCARFMSLGVVRLDRDTPIRSADERKNYRYTYDGTHTSEAGAQVVGRLVATRIRQFYQ